jgi:hypothetical protein
MLFLGQIKKFNAGKSEMSKLTFYLVCYLDQKNAAPKSKYFLLGLVLLALAVSGLNALSATLNINGHVTKAESGRPLITMDYVCPIRIVFITTMRSFAATGDEHSQENFDESILRQQQKVHFSPKEGHIAPL